MTASQMSLAELIGAGILLNADEAVAIARTLVGERSSSAAGADNPRTAAA